MSRIARSLRSASTRAARRNRAVADALAARRAGWFARRAEPVVDVEPFALGEAETARALAGGAVAFGPDAVALGRLSPWVVSPPSPAWRDALHGFDWAAHARAAGRSERAVLRGWARDWLARFGGGTGPGWAPDVAGRRLCSLAADARALSRSGDERNRRRLAESLGAHLALLERRWSAAAAGLPRIEAAAGLFVGAVATGRAGEREVEALGRAAEAAIRGDGGVASRDPERLALIFARLAWAVRVGLDAGLEPDPRVALALKRAGPALRALRLGDGALMRIHGGGAGAEGALDIAFARAERLARGPRRESAMGVIRLASGGAVVLIDAALPPRGPAAAASAGAIEISVGRRRLLGAVGPGARWGAGWSVAARATAAHSALEIDGRSSARLAPEDGAARTLGRPLVAGPSHVDSDRTEDIDGQWAFVEHDGYLLRYGLVATRRLNLSPDGRELRGEDTLAAPTPNARQRFDRAARDGGVPYLLRFHLRPEIEVEIIDEGRAARLAPPDAPLWVLRAAGGRLSIAEGVELDEIAGPTPSKQLVIAARVEAYWGRITWSLHRADPPRPPRPARAEMAADA